MGAAAIVTVTQAWIIARSEKTEFTVTDASGPPISEGSDLTHLLVLTHLVVKDGKVANLV